MYAYRLYTSEYMKYRTFGPRRTPEKNSSLNGIRTHDLRDTGAVWLHKLNYQVSWEQVYHVKNSLLSKLVRSRWLDIGVFILIACVWTSTPWSHVQYWP